MLEMYFAQSEQLKTRIWLSTDDQTAGGLMLQQLPDQDPEQHDENWTRINFLADTVTYEELLNLDAVSLLYRLFNEEMVRLLSTTVLEFACTCSRQRVADTIKLLGRQEAEDIIAERGFVELACEFCNTHYQFDPVDVAGLFSDPLNIQNDSDTLH